MITGQFCVMSNIAEGVIDRDRYIDRDKYKATSTDDIHIDNVY